MTIRVDFLQGADAMAPGLSRAQEPLLHALQSDSRFDVQAIRFPVYSGKLLFPFVYGPLPLWLAARHSPLLHIANAWYAHVLPLVRSPVIVTCHDLVEFERALSGDCRGKPHRRFHARAAFAGMLRARYIVCDSAAVAQRIAHYSPESQERLRVVHLGISSRFSPGPVDAGGLQALGVRQPYVLYVGSEQPRKNLERLVTALATARKQVPALQFVKVGAHQTSQGRARLTQALKEQHMLEHVRILEHVTDELLVQLYRGAAATALASLQEGFGFPPLEAMACGCPAIVSNRDSLPEIVGSAALLIDPLDVAAMARAIEQVACDARTRAELVRQGRVRAASYTWTRTAQAYARLYEETLGAA